MFKEKMDITLSSKLGRNGEKKKSVPKEVENMSK
jgi:hypothetical protein